MKLTVVGEINFSHSASAEFGADLVTTEFCSCRKGHRKNRRISDCGICPTGVFFNVQAGLRAAPFYPLLCTDCTDCAWTTDPSEVLLVFHLFASVLNCVEGNHIQTHR